MMRIVSDGSPQTKQVPGRRRVGDGDGDVSVSVVRSVGRYILQSSGCASIQKCDDN